MIRLAAGDKVEANKAEVEDTAHRLLTCADCTKTFTANFGRAGGVRNIIIVEHTSSGHSFKTIRPK